MQFVRDTKALQGGRGHMFGPWLEQEYIGQKRKGKVRQFSVQLPPCSPEAGRCGPGSFGAKKTE